MKQHIYHIIAFMVLVIALSACGSGPPWQQWMKEGPPPQDGVEYPADYVDGWKDGCETGISSNTNHLYKFMYDYKQDSSRILNDVYYRGWKDAFDYCQRYTRVYYGRKFL